MGRVGGVMGGRLTIADFQARTSGIAYAHRGAFFSELYLFVGLCLERGVTRVIESGVHHGVSTRVFRAIWPDGVTSIERQAESIPSDLPNVVVGDGVEWVPALVEMHRGERLGVFLDGPKGATAAALRSWCLFQPHVRVVAQHDSPVGAGEFRHSYDATFRRDIGDAIDARIPAHWRAHYAHGCPGMGVWVNA